LSRSVSYWFYWWHIFGELYPVWSEKSLLNQRAKFENGTFSSHCTSGPYSATFTEDGILDWAGGITRGRDAIRADVRGMREHFAKHEAADAPIRPARLRHVITNVVIRIDGNQAIGRAYWFELNDDVHDRRPYLGAYGHYEDELRKVHGHWLFSKRKIYNEQMDSRAASGENPAW
jgi:hypothetical protein